MKILTIVGARPQFIKAALLSRILRREHQEILVHTGQHFDANMSDVFFDELSIPHPDYNLGISGGSHGQMTGRMLMAIEEVLQQEEPQAVLLYGDTNSTLAAALAAVKLHLPVFHVESGNRFGTLDSPEEVNRICTDHVSTLRFACTESALSFLVQENLAANSYFVGDPMYDAFLFYRQQAEKVERRIPDLNDHVIAIPDSFYYLTCHRQENTDDAGKLQQILAAMEQLDAPVIYPVHPRNRNTVLQLQAINNYHNVIFVQPVGYLTSNYLVSHARKVITDSGGVQREAFFAGKQCVTVLNFVIWPETMVCGCNRLAQPDKTDILTKLAVPFTFESAYRPFGSGHACESICLHINNYFDKLNS